MTKTSGDNQTQTWHGVPESKCVDAYRKLSIVANNLVGLKQEQEKAVNCLSEGRDVSADMPTGYGELTFDI